MPRVRKLKSNATQNRALLRSLRGRYFLLREDGGYILREDGSKITRER